MTLLEQIPAIPAITVLCYLLAEGVKTVAPTSGRRHLPVLCGALGLALGMICHLWMPGYLPAENLIVAAAVGAVSGLAATGIDQSIKQEKS